MKATSSLPCSPRAQAGGALAWVIGILALLALLGVLALGALLMIGWNYFAEQAQAAVQKQPEVLEHIGTIREFDIDINGTAEAEGGDEFVFDLVGSKGRGRLRAHFITVDADHEALGQGSLVMADGTTITFDGGAR
ncbi:hypothetical protein [Arenimonas sp.]|uniref:hypothetical protein n=1 Tax=Arenimonas sp. TaxID=1872635 RepID=UPI0039E5136D